MASKMAKKSYTKRFKVTKTGKLLRRTQGLGHSRANKSRVALRRKDGSVEVHTADEKNIAARLN